MNQNRFYVPSFHFDTRGPCYCGSQKTFGDCCAATNGPRKALPNSILIANDFIPKEERESLIAYAEGQEREWLTVVDTGEDGEKKFEAKKHPNRITQRVHLAEKQKLVTSWMAKACKTYLAQTKAPVEWFETPQLLRYSEGGKYAMHSDAENYCHTTNQFYRFIDRDFSFLIYLNDGYEGGGLKFKGLNFSYQPKAGDLVIFPSNHVFSHESLPLISGTKYALVSWGVFKGTPRVKSPRQVVPMGA